MNVDECFPLLRAGPSKVTSPRAIRSGLGVCKTSNVEMKRNDVYTLTHGPQ